MSRFEIRLRAAATEQRGEEPTSFSFELEAGDEVVFGRAHDADIRIPDTERKVSSRHGKLICQADGSLRVHDLGSLNGTICNGEKVGEHGQPFSSDDTLQVGEWLLEVAPDASGELNATICSVDIKGTASRLAEALVASYDEQVDGDGDARRRRLQQLVDEATATLRPPEVSAVLGELGAAFELAESAPLATFANTLSPPAATASPRAPAAAAATAPPRTGGDPAGALAALTALAERLVPGQKFSDAAQMQRFAGLLEQVCTSSLTWLAKGLQSRGVFAQEFGAEVTLVFQRSNNPLKTMSDEQLRRYLLDWCENTPVETRKRYLDAVLQDLSEHQVAVLAGVREAIGGLIDRLSPDRIEALAKGGKGWSKARKAWTAFRELHAEMRDEQNKLYNEMITPAIQKGYLQQHGDESS